MCTMTTAMPAMETNEDNDNDDDDDDFVCASYHNHSIRIARSASTDLIIISLRRARRKNMNYIKNKYEGRSGDACFHNAQSKIRMKSNQSSTLRTQTRAQSFLLYSNTTMGIERAKRTIIIIIII